MSAISTMVRVTAYSGKCYSSRHLPGASVISDFLNAILHLERCFLNMK